MTPARIAFQELKAWTGMQHEAYDRWHAVIGFKLNASKIANDISNNCCSCAVVISLIRA